MNCQTTVAAVAHIAPLTDSVTELVLLPDHYVDYLAGQYLQIAVRGEWLSFSIANAPLGSKRYELHVRHNKNNAQSQALFAEIQQQGRLTLRLPLGDCHFNRLEPQTPILFIAGGTGFAPVKAMIEQLMATADARPFELYWGARNQSDLYMDDKLRNWADHVRHFCYVSQLAENTAEDTLLNRIKNHHQSNLLDFQIVICGPFDKVYSIRDELLRLGVSPLRLHSDAFAFPPLS